MTTTPLKPVLVAIGAAANNSDAALTYGCRRAVLLQRPLLLVHVVERGPGPLDGRLLQGAAARAGELSRGAVHVRTMTPTGPLIPTLVDVSRGADLVVLQRRTSSRMQRMVLGSVSTEVAGHAHAMTVVVPSNWEGSLTKQRRVVVGFGSTDDLAVVAHAFQRAALLDAELTIVHGWQMDTPYDDAIIGRRAVEEWRERYVETLRRAVAKLGRTTVSWQLKMLRAAPAEALLTACEDADLLVLGRGGIDVPLVGRLGSVARALVRDATCPVEVHCPLDEQLTGASPGRTPTTAPEPT